MQITVQREPLLEVCKLAERAVAARPLDPALENLYLQARTRDCLLTASDGVVGLRLRAPAQVGQPGPALVPARQFFGIVKAATVDELAILSEAGRVVVRGHEAAFELRGDDPGRFPGFPPCPDGAPVEIPPEPLRRAIQRTLFAAGEEASSHSRAGVLWELESDHLRLVATDNRRLAVAELSLRGAGRSGSPTTALLPVRAMELLGRLAAQADEPLRVLFGERHAFIRSAGAALCARLLEGRFPDWRKALPADLRYQVVLPAGEFLAGVKQAAVLHDRAAARVLVRFEHGRVTLRSRQQGTGRSWVRQSLGDPPVRQAVEVAFNPVFLTDLLKALDGDEVIRLELPDADGPALFRAGQDYRHVLMPLRQVDAAPGGAGRGNPRAHEDELE
jgi:DNA polymerase-3 subunit beta